MPLIRPRALKPGDTVALVAPSGSLKDARQVREAEAMLRGHGFVPQVAPGCTARRGYLAGPDDLRVADLHAAFADPGVSAVLCLKGGYGTPRILDALDHDLIARNPKIFVGYSDITALHLTLQQRCGLVTFHGPMGISEVLLKNDPVSTQSWLRALSHVGPLGRLDPPEGASHRCLQGGVARGPIVGGNLALVVTTLGTPYEIDTRNRILFLEDVAEEPYRVDRMLTQLRLAGKLAACTGILLGAWERCTPEEEDRSLSLAEVFADLLLPTGKPILAGFQAGHCAPMLTLPLGVEAMLDADAGSLTLMESALAE